MLVIDEDGYITSGYSHSNKVEIKYDTNTCPYYIGNTCSEYQRGYNDKAAENLKEIEYLANHGQGKQKILEELRKFNSPKEAGDENT